MKKIFYLLTTFVLLIYIESCTGYKPIFGSSNLEFTITDYSILGDKKLGNQIYSKLYGLSQSTKNTSEIKNIYVSINTSQNKNATTKSSSGKILGYRINLSTIITIKDSMTENEILNDTFSFSSTYKVQDQFSETIKLENQIIKNLIEKTYQNLLIKLSKNLL